jgi:thiosulfate/3-mercaptopyruvate sulfurtransferase
MRASASFPWIDLQSRTYFHRAMLVSTALLGEHLDDPAWVIFDCRHDLFDHAKGERLYRLGHLPGAFFAPVETALSGPKTGKNGRHPLPEPQAFADFLADHGVSEDTTVIAYDDVGGQFAARLWWMTRWIGLSKAALLDGGLGKWTAEGRPLTGAAPPRRAPSGLRARPQWEMVWTTRDVEQRLDRRDSLLLDARTAERFRGETEPIDPVAGHVPGSVCRFYKQNLNADQTLRPREELKREFENLIGSRNAGDVGHQCGSGVTACANLFAMEYAGLRGSKLYAGSWSEWIADPARPVARS